MEFLNGKDNFMSPTVNISSFKSHYEIFEHLKKQYSLNLQVITKHRKFSH